MFELRAIASSWYFQQQENTMTMTENTTPERPPWTLTQYAGYVRNHVMRLSGKRLKHLHNWSTLIRTSWACARSPIDVARTILESQS